MIGKEKRGPAVLQVIVLGSGGGPIESNVTSFLVRSTTSGWRRGSVIALDAGVHLSAITRILEETLPQGLGKSKELSLPHTLESGPFAGVEVPYESLIANAGFVQSSLIDTYLITHPHLDHISGFVINTAGLPSTRPKRLAGLPSTISAFKSHIFNNVIWPNLSDENNGAGLVTYMRLVEGGSPALGEGDSRGYLEISDELSVKVWSVSHGHCIEQHSHRGSGASTRYGSLDASSAAGLVSPRLAAQHNATSASFSHFPPSHQQLSGSIAVGGGGGGGAGPGRPSISMPSGQSQGENVCVYDSSAYFIRHIPTGKEILMFGDVEPDSVSLSPRNTMVWSEAATKVANGKLAAIFIECSHDDSRSPDRLYGHMTPRYIIEELSALALNVQACRATSTHKEGGEGRKRKRTDETIETEQRRTAVKSSSAVDDPVSPKTVKATASFPLGRLQTPSLATPTRELSLGEAELSIKVQGSKREEEGEEEEEQLPLSGLKVVIIHVKERFKDGPTAGEIVMEELMEHEKEAKLGCEFIMTYPGQSLEF